MAISALQPLDVTHTETIDPTPKSSARTVFLRVDPQEEPLKKPSSFGEWMLQLGEILDNTELQDDILTSQLKSWSKDLLYYGKNKNIEEHLGENLADLSQLLSHPESDVYFKDLVIYQGTVFEYEFLQTYFEHWGPAEAPIYTHLLAKKLGHWLRGLTEFMGTKEACPSLPLKTFQGALECKAEFDRLVRVQKERKMILGLKSLFEKYHSSEWVDPLSSAIRKWGKTVSISEMETLTDTVIIDAKTKSPLENPVIYDGVYLDATLMEKIDKYCQPLKSPIQLHDFAKDILMFSKQFMVPKKAEIAPIKQNALLVMILGANAPRSLEDSLLPGMHRQFYLKELEDRRTIQTDYKEKEEIHALLSDGIANAKKKLQSNTELAKKLFETLLKHSEEVMQRIELSEEKCQKKVDALKKAINSGNQNLQLLEKQVRENQREVEELKWRNARLEQSIQRVEAELQKAKKKKKKKFLGIL